ncbi:MAG: hypothetical protein PHY48_11000 [Candidatus Cloacimonetes bacterium]|nr:hypothetical protein [Candidatus Cloacimonadota bacterium]
MDKDNLHKEIDLIQACITRMANNSFLLKGWTISLVAVVMALMKDNVNLYILCTLLLVPIIAFWYLDAFFLRTEKMYRKLYEWIIEARPKGNTDKLYDLNPLRFKDEVDSMWKVMISKTLRVFYGIMVLTLLCVMVTKFGTQVFKLYM